MREHKYKAWSPGEKKMYPVFTPFHEDMSIMEQTDLPLHIAPWSKFIILQYTDLKDKNGKEIYEGDIVSRFGDTQRSVVEFKDGCFVSTIQLSGIDEPHDEILQNDLAVTKVIGNIYSNPELIK